MTRLVCGLQPVREAIRVHGNKVSVVYTEEKASPKIERLQQFATDQGIRITKVSSRELDHMSRGTLHQGVIAMAPELKLVSVESLLNESTIIALDGIMDPHNFGAIVRSSVALGARAILWPENASAPLSPTMFRSSAGAIEHALLCKTNSLHGAIHTFNENGFTTIALDSNASELLSNVTIGNKIVLVIGSEDKGIRTPIKKACTHLAKLPMIGPIQSLNASVAGAVALYEVWRKRST